MYDETNMPVGPETSKPDIDDFPSDAYDNYISTQVKLPRGDTYEQATILQHKCDNEGYLIGYSDENPILNT